jgi:hypothetical protein
MQIDTEAWAKLLDEQECVVKRSQAMSCGWTQNAIQHRLDRKHWQVLVPGVLLVVSGTPTARQRLRAALLHGGPEAALTSTTACELHGLERARPTELVHVAAPATSAPVSSCFIRVWPTTRPLPTMLHDGLVVVSVARAVVDAGLQMKRQNDVRALVSEAVQRGRLGPAALAAELAIAPRRGSRHLRTTLEEIEGGARSAPEAVLLRALRCVDGLPSYELNANVHDDNGRLLACSDVVFRAQRLLVEVDGAAWHLSPERWAADLDRHTRLEAAGWTVLRYPASRVLTDAAGVVREIAACLATRS